MTVSSVDRAHAAYSASHNAPTTPPLLPDDHQPVGVRASDATLRLSDFPEAIHFQVTQPPKHPITDQNMVARVGGRLARIAEHVDATASSTIRQLGQLADRGATWTLDQSHALQGKHVGFHGSLTGARDAARMLRTQAAMELAAVTAEGKPVSRVLCGYIGATILHSVTHGAVQASKLFATRVYPAAHAAIHDARTNLRKRLTAA